MVFGSAHAAEGSGSNKQTVFKVIAPPDPNFIPVAVLREKVSELAPGIAVEIVTAPSGDPSAMRAMLYSRAADFALFSTLGGSRFYGAGLDNIALVGVHVWKGVWLVGQKGLKGPEALNGKRVLAVPAIKTPPHMVIEKSLNDKGIRPDFVSGGAGPVLMAQLSNPAKAPLAFVAPEPMVSILLARQLKEKWPVQYAVMPLWGTVAGFGAGETALGALWAVDPQRLAANPGASQAFVAGFRDAVAFVNDPANHDEVSKIVARTMREIYGQAAPASVYRSMLASGRLKLDFRPTAAVRARVVRDLNDTYGFRVDEGIFRPVF
ncbi:MAG: hypothetical protein RAO75_03785 [Candidatus Chlorobium antarcticum]|nr:hypothetical protein [Candidatus Chlorobium antarcticum]